MIAVIAGTGSLPVEACNNLTKNKNDFFVISLFPEDNLKELKEMTKNNIPIYTQNIYKTAQILKILKENKTKKVLLIGKVDKRNFLKKFKLDWLGIKFFTSLVCKSDSTIMETLIKFLAQNNIEVIPQNQVLKSLIIPPGILTGKITKQLQENIQFGLDVAQKISECDIGQTVIVKDKMILAIEAIEGTDNCIKRGIELGIKDVIVCKAAQINQNKKYDLPTLGPSSLKYVQKDQIKAIAWQSSQTLIADKEEFIEKANKLGITLISV